MINNYLANPKDFVKKVRLNKEIKKKLITTYSEGLLQGVCFAGIPIFVKQINPNFKKKLFIGSIPLVSLKRRAPKLNDIKKEKGFRSSRIYISLGSLPYYDNRSGIPRVAKNLCYEGLKYQDRDCIPVYPDPISGKYRIAYQWCRVQNLIIKNLPEISDDEEITVREGDWLIHTMINPNELIYEKTYFESFRETGGKIGFVLHDIIAEEYPEFFKLRDHRLFTQWLRLIVYADGLFAISEATKNAFIAWAKKEGISKIPSCEVFPLGVDFSYLENISCKFDLPKQLKSTPYFLQVSTLEPRKGYSHLLDVFEKLWKKGVNVNLVFVGRQGWCVKGLIRRIKTHPQLNKHLFWYNGIGDEELLALYQDAKAIIVASQAEGFGLSVIEGLYFNKEVIARDIPVFHEIAGNAITYFSNENELGSLIERCMSKEYCGNKQAKWIPWKQSFSYFMSCIKKIEGSQLS